MKMNEIIDMLPSLVAGGILGIIFFGGLWLTIQRALHSKKAAFAICQSALLSEWQLFWQDFIMCLNIAGKKCCLSCRIFNSKDNYNTCHSKR